MQSIIFPNLGVFTSNFSQLHRPCHHSQKGEKETVYFERLIFYISVQKKKKRRQEDHDGPILLT